MSLNEEQKAHMEWVAKNPDLVCGCGWLSTHDCRLSCCSKPNQRPLDQAYSEGYQHGKEVLYNQLEQKFKWLYKMWGSACPDKEDVRKSKIALDAMIHEFHECKPRNMK